jgi:hypothetical protein
MNWIWICLFALALPLVFCLFFQVYPLSRLRIGLDSHRRLFQELRNNERSLDQARDECEWLRWVWTSVFGPSASALRVTREESLEQLDNWLLDRPEHRLLHRTGVLPPVVGLTVTVVSFLMLAVPENTSAALSSIFKHVQPIFWGVLAGALLTGLTQLYILPAAASSFADTRREAVAWFDEAVWPRLARPGDPSVERLLTAVQEIMSSLETAAKRISTVVTQQQGASRQLEESSRLIQGSSKAFGASCAQFEEVVQETILPAFAELRQIDSVLTALRATLEGFQNLQELEPRVTGLLAGLTAATNVAQEVAQLPQQIRTALTAVREEYDTALDRFEEVGTGVVGHVRAAIDPLAAEVSELNETLGSLQNSAQAFRELLVLAPRLQPLLEGLRVAGDTATAVARLPDHIENALQVLARDLPKLAERMKQTTEEVLEREVALLPEMLNQAIQQVRRLDEAARVSARPGSDGESRK